MFCYQKNFSNPTQPVDEAQFYALVRASKWNENIDKYRETGDAALKRKLPAFIFQATFDETASKAGKVGRWRKQAATRLTGLVVMDIDHVEDPRATFESWNIIGTDSTASKEHAAILLVYVTPSGKGLKIVFKARLDWGNLIDNQHTMAKVLGVEVDESCKDASRMSFICKESDILFINKELFTYENKEFGEKYDAEYRAAVVANKTVEQRTGNVGQMDAQPVGNPLKWRGYEIQEIIDARYSEKVPCKEDSNRHTESLKLATDLLLMLDGDKGQVLQIVKAQSWVQEIIDERNEDVEQTVASAADCVAQKEKKYASSQPSKAMLEAIQKVCGRSYQEIIKGVSQTVVVSDDDISRWLWDWGEQIEALSEEFPILKDICKGLKRNQYPAALFVAGGLMMTLMTRCTYRFYHRPEELRRLNNSTFIIGDPASGKSFATRLFKLLAAPIVAADKMLDNTVTVQKGGSWIDKQSLELKAFHNEEDGQAYSNNDSILQDFYVTWNFIYTGTPIALKKKVNEQNFGSGLATRLTCIPLPTTNFEMMTRERSVDFDSDGRLKEWAFKLDRMKGLLTLDKIVDELYDWTARRMADAKDNDSKADEMLLKRCAYHGLNFSAPFIVMRHWEQMHQDGEFWCGEFETDEVDWKLAELIVNIQYACQRHYFGAMAETYFENKNREAAVNTRRNQKTYDGFQRLPELFTREDVIRCFNLHTDSAAWTKISRFLKDHLIEKDETYSEEGSNAVRYKKIGVMVW